VVEPPDAAALLIECDCCAALWIVSIDEGLDRILVGSEG
jgi:hypothetical protein